MKLNKELKSKDYEYIRWYPPSLEKTDDFRFSRYNIENNCRMGIYVHIPFCQTICKYCPFIKRKWNPILAAKYVDYLKKEMTIVACRSDLSNKKVRAIYFGGGTPTTLTIQQIGDIYLHLHSIIKLNHNPEVSIEANPDTVTYENLKLLKEIGFNRISFGVQSFNNGDLNRIGRVHKAEDSVNAVEMAKQAGLQNVGIDLLYNIPGQNIRSWEKQIAQAVKLDIQHISVYNLFIPRGTELYKNMHIRKEALYKPYDNQEFELYQKAVDVLKHAGYKQYTVYDFAKGGYESVHHDINWRAPQGEYCSFGAGAFSYFKNTIYSNTGDIDDYFQQIVQQKMPVSKAKVVNDREQISRFMVLGLKYLKVSRNAFGKIFGHPMEYYFDVELRQLIEQGWLEKKGEYYCVTSIGSYYITNVCKTFYTKQNIGIRQPRA